MKVTFDPHKREATLADRGIDFQSAGKAFAGRYLTAKDARRDYGEPRFQTVGYLDGRIGDGGLDAARRCTAHNLDEEMQ